MFVGENRSGKGIGQNDRPQPLLTAPVEGYTHPVVSFPDDSTQPQTGTIKLKHFAIGMFFTGSSGNSIAAPVLDKCARDALAVIADYQQH